MPRLIPVAAAAAALLLVGACSRTVRYTSASGKTYPSKPSNCELSIFSTPPQQPYEELGTFDIEPATQSQVITSVGELKQVVGPDACKLGADALIAFSDRGSYERAVAIRWTTPAPAAAEAPAPAPPQ